MRREIVTVQRFGDEMGIALPEEMVERLGWKEGDTLHVVAREDGILLTADATFTRAMEVYGVMARKYENALRELADS